MAQFGVDDPFQVCCISLNMTDRLRLIACPPELIPDISTCINRKWGQIQHKEGYHGSYEFKLRGNPWSGEGHEAVDARRLLTGILTVMAYHGWNLIQATDCSKKQTDKDTLFFEKGVPDKNASLFAMSFNRYDRIRIIDQPQFMKHVEKAITTSWPRGTQGEREYCGSLELKLAGDPWFPEGEQAVHSKILLAQIISNFKSIGYKLYGSVDISGKSGKDVGDLDSWVFRKVGPCWN